MKPNPSSVSGEGQEETSSFAPVDGFWLARLRSQAGDVSLGILGVEAKVATPDLAPEEGKIARLLKNESRHDSLAPFKGIVVAILFSLPFWLSLASLFAR